MRCVGAGNHLKQAGLDSGPGLRTNCSKEPLRLARRIKDGWDCSDNNGSTLSIGLVLARDHIWCFLNLTCDAFLRINPFPVCGQILQHCGLNGWLVGYVTHQLKVSEALNEVARVSSFLLEHIHTFKWNGPLPSMAYALSLPEPN